MKILRNPTAWGAGALVLATIVALVTGMVYVNPPGEKIVTFYTDDAAAVRPGDPVRIAGINVGKVKDLALEANQVRVRAGVDGSAFVGDQSQVQVRMLTVVGGYYVNIVSLGSSALNSKPIPVERVTMPYSLIRTLTDATKITDNVDPKPVKASLDEVQQGLAGTNVDSVAAVIDAGNTIMSTIERQRGQVSAILDLSNEYVRDLNDYSDKLQDIVRRVAIIEQTITLYSEGLAAALQGMGNVLDSLSPIFIFYQNHRDKVLTRLRDWVEKATMWAERNGVIVRGIRLGRRKIERILDAQQATPELLATDLCMPIPGSGC
ncbi:MlaD family protein [Mycolicibacter algericus]|uniref:Mammalian cell entry protein n=2 Tax=Mycolicibacter algericus TaxID=1288388 RepID=A0ABX3RLR2_MYCAL|nr:MlaD family protein [Mycolicibacter algericus]OQZ94853.1 mammalian cell entry protein [Mycolicibacter algericus DSM 45454]GFG83908.1 putative Mce family protein [Mycolicibacter algericus]